MNHENIVSEFNRSLKSLQAAQILMKEDLYEDAVSRGYYAVMHAAKAALFYHNTLAESHAALRRLFGKILVNSGHIEKEWVGTHSFTRTGSTDCCGLQYSDTHF